MNLIQNNDEARTSHVVELTPDRYEEHQNNILPQLPSPHHHGLSQTMTPDNNLMRFGSGPSDYSLLPKFSHLIAI
jgi:hypothetical protein